MTCRVRLALMHVYFDAIDLLFIDEYVDCQVRIGKCVAHALVS